MKRISYYYGLLIALALASCQETITPAYMVKSVEQGDISCYIELERDGKVSMHSGDFAICQKDWIGKRVVIETREEKVQSAQCQGDPECTLSETVPLIVQMKKVE